MTADLRQVQYIDEYEASRITGFAVQSFRNWRHLRRGPGYVKVGRSIRYSLAGLVEWMERHRVEQEDAR